MPRGLSLFRLTRRRLWWQLPLILLLVLAGLFALNGLLLARDETPLVVKTGQPLLPELAGEAAPELPAGEGLPLAVTPPARKIKVMAYNIAKCFIHAGGISFVSKEAVTARLERLAAVIRQEQPDLLFLSEAVLECGPAPVNQVAYLAEATGMSCWAFGENFNFGLPGYRITSGNAILTRTELVPVANPSLAGRKPFYVTMNNRRVLFCQARMAGKDVLLGSIHTDSFNLENNTAQARQILDFCRGQPTILAGDFNARPSEPAIQLVRESGRFVGSTEDVGTFPAESPEQTIDFIFAPQGWELLEHHVPESDASDHRPVVATFRVAW